MEKQAHKHGAQTETS